MSFQNHIILPAMETTDFAKHLSNFLTKHLMGERSCSSNTILSYKDTFVQFIQFMKECKGLRVSKITLEHITKEVVLDFLDFIQKSRKCGNATRNARLAALRSFFNYLQYETPERMHQWQRILSVKNKRHQKQHIKYLTTDGIKALFEQPDLDTRRGRRNLALLSLLYDSGARVQEIIDLTPSCIRLDKPCSVKISGKGGKARIVPLQEEQTVILYNYMQESRLLELHANKHPLFSNSRNEKLTRSGITYILSNYVELARKTDPSIIPEKVSCHSLRHSKAMHLLQAGVNLIYIRDLLGHASIQTTDAYARADSKQKRKAFEQAYVDLNPDLSKTKSWETNTNLLSWLKSLSK